MRRAVIAMGVVLFVALAPLVGNAAPRSASVPSALAGSDLEEQLGERVEDGLRFVDQEGRSVSLGDVAPPGKPVILSLFYYRCPTLCGLLLQGLVEGLRGLSLQLGQDYRLVTVSFDPRDQPEDARRKREAVFTKLGRDASKPEWAFLTSDGASSRALADRIGFHYAEDRRTGEYAHPAALVVLTPDHRIARYLYGVSFEPRELRMALVEAGQGKVGTLVDRAIVSCYRYDAKEGAYVPRVLSIVRAFGALLVAAAFALSCWLLAVERRRARLARGAAR
jgi:protein SCO1/2